MVRSINPKIMVKMKLFMDICVDFRFLFGWKSPLGYITTVSLQYMIVVYEFTFLASMIIFAGGVALFLIAVTKDIHAILKSINDGAKNDKNRLHIARQLIRFVKLHCDSKQLSRLKSIFFSIFRNIDRLYAFRPLNDLMQLFEPSLMIMFAWSIVTVSGAMLMIRIEMVSIYLPATISLQKIAFLNCNCLPFEITRIELSTKNLMKKNIISK